ncbi:FUSC family protein [Sphingomonas oryzagri]
MPSPSPSWHLSELVGIDRRKLLFAWSNFLAAAATLIIAFEASLPRPWWALLTVYVTAQPMSGAFRPKMLYRFGGIAVGAAMTILLVPNLQNSPILLVFCLAVWTGFCIYLAVLDRTPRAFLFQMAAFSAAVMSFPYLDDPQDIFTTTISRVEEMSVAILCVTLMHMLMQPWSVRPIIRERAKAFLVHMSGWTAEALGSRHNALEYEHRRRLATDVVELGMIAVHLPFDQRFALATRETVIDLQHEMAAVLPIASAAANRLDRLRALSAVDTELEALVDKVARWLKIPSFSEGTAALALVASCRAVSSERLRIGDWPALLAASLCDRMAALIEVVANARRLVARFDDEDAVVERREEAARRAPRFALARDHGLAALAGAATATAICLYCAVWILLAWPNGSATAAFAALITCSFAAQDDPAPVIGRYLLATLITFPLAALYLFVLLPRVDGAGVLIEVLAPALLWMGYIQADPARSAHALPMFSCFIVAMGFLDRFQADFALFLNTGLAQVGGIVATLTVTRLFRSANVRWTARRIIRANWRDLEALADPRQPLAAETWTAHAVDRLGQIAARMAEASPGDTLHAADGLDDLRIGRNLIQIRQSATRSARIRKAVAPLFEEVGALFRARLRAGHPVPAPDPLLTAIDDTMAAATARPSATTPRLLLALVGMRCNLFPSALPYQGAAG